MLREEIKYYVAISLIPGIGCMLAKRLIAYCGSAEAVLREKKSALQKIPGIGTMLAQEIAQQQLLQQAEEECRFLEKNNFQALCYTDSAYPQRLVQCEDGPIVLFVKGAIDFNQSKFLSIVGTRHATPYGLEWCENTFIEPWTYSFNACLRLLAMRLISPPSHSFSNASSSA